MRALLPLLLCLAACQSGPTGPVTEAGSLEAGDMTLASGEFYDSFSVNAREGQWIEVEVIADGFDPYLILRSPSEEQSEMDDSEEGDTSTTRMAIRAPESGRWLALVTSYAPGGTGTYTVTYSVSDQAPTGLTPDPASSDSSEAETIDV